MTETVNINRGRLTDKQLARLVQAIDPNHVDKKQGRLTYMAQHEVRAELTRIFGYGNWDTQVEDMQMIYETEILKDSPQYPKSGDGKPYYVACYRAHVTLRIRDFDGYPVAEFSEWHAEENAPLPNRGEAHAMAMTSVESYALRRAAIGLGDRFGLGLYDKGQTVALVKGSIQLQERKAAATRAPESPENMEETQTPMDEEIVAQRGAQDAAAARVAQGFKRPPLADVPTMHGQALREVENG